jgi:hypothetical protein
MPSTLEAQLSATSYKPMTATAKRARPGTRWCGAFRVRRTPSIPGHPARAHIQFGEP